VTKVVGSNAVGHGRKDGTVGAVTAVVTAVVLISAVDDNVCAVKEVIGAATSDAESSVGGGFASTFTSTASTELSGTDVLVDSASCSSLGLDFFGAAALSSSSFEPELVWAPPVLTTTPGGACDVVDPVEVDEGLSSSDGSDGSDVTGVLGVSILSAGSAEGGVADVDESVDVDSADDDSDDGVSAHATGNPYPVTTAAPTPRATAKPPTRPT
jgi:hypothetical protein